MIVLKKFTSLEKIIKYTNKQKTKKSSIFTGQDNTCRVVAFVHTDTSIVDNRSGIRQVVYKYTDS